MLTWPSFPIIRAIITVKMKRFQQKNSVTKFPASLRSQKHLLSGKSQKWHRSVYHCGERWTLSKRRGHLWRRGFWETVRISDSHRECLRFACEWSTVRLQMVKRSALPVLVKKPWGSRLIEWAENSCSFPRRYPNTHAGPTRLLSYSRPLSTGIHRSSL